MKLKKIKISILLLGLCLALQACSILGLEDKTTINNDVKIEENSSVEADKQDNKDTSDAKDEENVENENPSDQIIVTSDDDQKKDTKITKLSFNSQATKELRDTASNYNLSLVEDNNQEGNNIEAKDLTAIAKFDNSDSFGWIVKYGKNKIGVASVYKEGINNIMTIFGEKTVFFESSRKTPIKNDSPADYKKAAQELINVFFTEGNTNISWSY